MPKLYGISLDSLAEYLGVKFQKVEGVQDQLWIFKTSPSSHKASCDDWLEWIVSCTKQLYRCPSADDETIRRRVEEGECLGMAYRFARRFTCSTVSVSHIQKQKNAGLHHFEPYFWSPIHISGRLVACYGGFPVTAREKKPDDSSTGFWE